MAFFDHFASVAVPVVDQVRELGVVQMPVGALVCKYFAAVVVSCRFEIGRQVGLPEVFVESSSKRFAAARSCVENISFSITLKTVVLTSDLLHFL